jgi:hypothetical protein
VVLGTISQKTSSSFFYHVVLQRQHKPDDGHEQTWHSLASQDHVNALLQSLDFCQKLNRLRHKLKIKKSTRQIISQAKSPHFCVLVSTILTNVSENDAVLR